MNQSEHKKHKWVLPFDSFLSAGICGDRSDNTNGLAATYPHKNQERQIMPWKMKEDLSCIQYTSHLRLNKYAGSSDRQHLVRGVGHVWLAVRTKNRKGKREKGKKTWQTYPDFVHPWCGGEATSFPAATSPGKAKTMPSIARVHGTLA